MSRDFKVVPQIVKSDHMGIIFEIKCNNNKDTVMRVKKNWGKFLKNDFENIALQIDWKYSSDELSSQDMFSI